MANQNQTPLQKIADRIQKGIQRGGREMRDVASLYFGQYIRALIPSNVRMEGTSLTVRRFDNKGKGAARVRYIEKGNAWNVTANGPTVQTAEEACILAGGKTLHFIRDGKEGGKVPEALMAEAKAKWNPPADFQAAVEFLIDAEREKRPPSLQGYVLGTPVGQVALKIGTGKDGEGESSLLVLQALCAHPDYTGKFTLVKVNKGGKSDEEVALEAQLAGLRKSRMEAKIAAEKAAVVSRQPGPGVN